jgi:DNA-binding PadR family transcriptional regulator
MAQWVISVRGVKGGGGPPFAQGRGFGPGGPDDGANIFEPTGARRVRMFGTGDLRILLIAMLGERPMHGYELIQSISQLAGGEYSPSPGAIYPTLSLLEEQELIEPAVLQSGKKSFALTKAGQQSLAQDAAEAKVIRERLAMLAATKESSFPPFPVRRAMHQLKHALLRPEAGWPEKEITRVTAILERAVAEIFSR